MKIHFITGRLAEYSLRSLLPELAQKAAFDYTIQVMPITVAALMTTDWIAKRITIPPDTSQIVIPGYCTGSLETIRSETNIEVQRGPRDLRQLADWFGQEQKRPADYGAYDIDILAEINHCPRLLLPEILALAERLRNDGADVIDVGCDPGEIWTGVADCVHALRDAGHRVSIDSMNPIEIESAVQAGAELVLSVNASNRLHANQWGCEVVVIPDDFATLGGLEETVEMLRDQQVPFRIDPVLEPIGIGFAASLSRYHTVRSRYADVEMMMGIGNLTELTDADSGPINILLLGICQELGIRSVLTTQVINWARTSVKECDLARRLVHYAVRHKTMPKHLEPDLVALRDARLYPVKSTELEHLAGQIKDKNFRIFVADDQIHLISAKLHLKHTDPFLLLDALLASGPDNLDTSHSFYLGYEMAKAVTAMTLGKEYRQDEALDWGFLSMPEQKHRGQTPARRANEEQQ